MEGNLAKFTNIRKCFIVFDTVLTLPFYQLVEEITPIIRKCTYNIKAIRFLETRKIGFILSFSDQSKPGNVSGRKTLLP